MLLADGNSNDTNWPLVNKKLDDSFAFLGNDAGIDKRVAAYLLVSGILLGEFSTETLKQADWRSRCKAAEAQVSAQSQTIDKQARTIDEQSQTIDEQAQRISTLEAELSALKLRRPIPTAKI